MFGDHVAAGAMPAIDPSAVDAVVFDIGGVFTIRHHEAIRIGARHMRWQLPDGPQPYHLAHHVAIRAVSDLLAAAGPDQDQVHDYDPRVRMHWERSYLASLGVPPDLLDEAAQAMITELSASSAREVWRQLLPENVQGLHRIIASGMPVAVVSNNDGTAEDQLRSLGVCQVGSGPLPSVTIVVDSTLAGAAKPDPAIFRPALQALGTDPSRTLYVGDSVHSDVRGATAAGLPVVQLDPYDLHADFAHARIPDVGELATLLLADR